VPEPVALQLAGVCLCFVTASATVTDPVPVLTWSHGGDSDYYKVLKGRNITSSTVTLALSLY
jgi:hypothetical protein